MKIDLWELCAMYPSEQVAEVMGVKYSTLRAIRSGWALIRAPHLYRLKVRWPEFDIADTVMRNCRTYNRKRARRALSTMMDN